MDSLDFPTWFGLGSYGGLACCMLAAGAVAGFALLRHRGTPRTLARAVLICLVAGCLSLVPIWWGQDRLDRYGPSLAAGEVTFWLAWTALAGWFLPLGVLAGYIALAPPQVQESAPAPAGDGRSGPLVSMLDDPARLREPLGAGRAWGVLIPLDGEDPTRTVALSRQLTLIGREFDNDIVVDDERTSRHHAELRWEHGHVQLLDRGSMNGTRLNRQAVRGVVPLKSGDILEIGAQRYRFEMAAVGAANGAEEETRKMRGALPAAALAAPPTLVLVALAGALAGARWGLAQDITTIGRDAERQVCLPHDSVSRLHAQIVRQRSGYFVADLNSSNGTFVNEAPVTEPQPLRAGDLLRCGEITLRCELSTAQVHAHNGVVQQAAPLATHLAGRAIETPQAPYPSRHDQP
ncbi:MAG TPA: FHA domain-containing protein, partial [Ktedonobacterales bacterium]|nr:FHA domain-containing protein [Ktedonobacterales bacterium]